MFGNKFGKASGHALALVNRQQIAGNQLGPGGVKLVTLYKTRNLGLAPGDHTIIPQLEGRRCRCGKGADPVFNLVWKATAGCRQNGCLLVTFIQGRLEYKSVEDTNFLTLDENCPVILHRRHKISCFLQLATQMRSAAVNKTFRQTLMQTVGKPVFDGSGPILPLRRVVCPVRTMCDIGPCPDIGKTGHQRINIPVQPVKLVHRTRHHIRAQPAIARQRHEQPGQKVIMIFIQTLPKIGNTGHFPQQADAGRIPDHGANISAIRQRDQGAVVQRIRLAEQKWQRRRCLKGLLQGVYG